MEVYHASMVRVERPDVYHSRKFLDFGQGFYVTTLEAKYWRTSKTLCLAIDVC